MEGEGMTAAGIPAPGEMLAPSSRGGALARRDLSGVPGLSVS